MKFKIPFYYIFFVKITIVLIFFSSCNFFFNKDIQITEKNIGPYIFAGVEFPYDSINIKQQTRNLKLQLEKEDVKSNTMFLIYRRKNLNSNKIMIGFILSDNDLNKIRNLRKNGILVQEMGITKSVYTKISNRQKIEYISDFKEINKFIENYAISQNYSVNPILGIISGSKIEFSMEISM